MAAAGGLTREGYGVWVPLCHSPDIDLLAQREDAFLRVQVKTSSAYRRGRFEVALRTTGGNQSWSGLSKRLDPSRYDYLFVLVADGRRWFIPAGSVGGCSGLLLGGPKYAGFEVDRRGPGHGPFVHPAPRRIGGSARGSARAAKGSAL